jgi:hypothetical protein
VLAIGLLPLLELAAARGDHAADVERHGQRLVADVLRTDDDTWQRRRPELLSPTVGSAALADAGRLLRLLPGFGVPDAHCRFVRQLLLAELRERRDRGADGPEVLAARLYGYADLLPETERSELERQLRRWRPALLAPDFVTLLQVAWGMEPGRLGVSQYRRGLRQLAVQKDPMRLGSRAGLCLCLCSSYASAGSAVPSASD